MLEVKNTPGRLELEHFNEHNASDITRLRGTLAAQLSFRLAVADWRDVLTALHWRVSS